MQLFCEAANRTMKIFRQSNNDKFDFGHGATKFDFGQGLGFWVMVRRNVWSFQLDLATAIKSLLIMSNSTIEFAT